MNKARQVFALCVGAIGFSSILLTTNAFPFQLASVFQNQQALLPAQQLGQQAIAQSAMAADQSVSSPEATTGATQAEIEIRQQQVEVARQYESYRQGQQDLGTGTRASVLSASMVRMDYEVELLQAKQLFEEAIALREQQVEVAEEYEEIEKLRLQMSVGTPEEKRDASFSRLEYELKLLQEKQALQDM